MTKPATLGNNVRPSEYRAGGVVYRQAFPADDTVLKSILRYNAMESWVSLSTEHEPSYFASADLFGQTQTIVAYQENDNHSSVGMCSYTKLPVHVNGKPVSAGYLGELRVCPAFRNKISIIRHGFKSVKLLSETHTDIAYWFTSIATENSAARRLLEANLSGMPIYRPQGELVTMALPVKSEQRHKHASVLQTAKISDIPALVEFYNQQARAYQYSPVLSEKWLRSLNGSNGLRLQDFYLIKEGSSILACFALWDQRQFKQTIVRGYRFPLNIIRRPYNLFARLAGRVVLPALGEPINYIFIAFIAVDKAITQDGQAFLASALAQIKSRHANLAMVGLAKENPLIKTLASIPKQTYHTCIESVYWPDKQAVEQTNTPVDNRPVQPEIAIA